MRRIKIEGQCASADILRNLLKESGFYTEFPLTIAADYVIRLEQEEGIGIILFDSGESELGKKIRQELYRSRCGKLLLDWTRLCSGNEATIRFSSEQSGYVEAGLFNAILRMTIGKRRNLLFKAAVASILTLLASQSFAQVAPQCMWDSTVSRCISAGDTTNRAIRVNVVASSASGGTVIQGAGAGAATNYWNTRLTDGTNFIPLPTALGGSGGFKIECLSGCGGAAAFADAAAFTFGTSSIGNVGFVVDDVGTNTVAENSAGTPRMNTNRIAYANLRNNAGTEITSWPVTGTFFQATQPISAVALPLPAGAATSALQTQPGVDIGDVTINNAGAGNAVNVQDGGNSITVDGTVTSNQGTAAALTAGWPIADQTSAVSTAAWTSGTPVNTTLPAGAGGLDVRGYATVTYIFRVLTPGIGITAGTALFECSHDATNWVSCKGSLNIYNTCSIGFNLFQDPTTGQIDVAGFTNFRLRLNPVIVGAETANITLAASSMQAGPCQSIDNDPLRVAGPAADGSPAVEAPVQIGGKTSAGNIQTLNTDDNGNLTVASAKGPVASVTWTSATAVDTSLVANVGNYAAAAFSLDVTGTITAGVVNFECSYDAGVTYPFQLLGVINATAAAGSQLKGVNYSLNVGDATFERAVSGCTHVRARLNPVIAGAGSVAIRINPAGFPNANFNISTAMPTDPNGADLTTAVGTQAARAIAVQEQTDAGRSEIRWYAVAVAAGATTVETLITLTRSTGTAATAAASTYTITSGKRLRFTNITFATRGHATATIQTTTFNFRINAGGACIVSSTPIAAAVRSATPAVASQWDRVSLPFPEGWEILGNGTIAFCVSANATYVTNAPTWDVFITGYEY